MYDSCEKTQHAKAKEGQMVKNKVKRNQQKVMNKYNSLKEY